jgi:predicted enzyme related to lactoylglutathione lyase
MSVPTYGLSHIALKVRDLGRAVAFYEAAFGVKQYFRNERTAQVLGPGPTDVIAFELMPEGAGQAGGLMHFGLRLRGPERLDEVIDRVVAAGGKVLQRRLRLCSIQMDMKSSCGTRTHHTTWRPPVDTKAYENRYFVG